MESSADSTATASATATATQTPTETATQVEGHRGADDFSPFTLAITILCLIPAVAIAIATRHSHSRNGAAPNYLLTGLRIFAFSFAFLIIGIGSWSTVLLRRRHRDPVGDVEGVNIIFCEVSDLELDFDPDVDNENDEDDDLAFRPGEIGAPTDDFAAGQCTPEEGYTPDRSAMHKMMKERLAELKKNRRK
ncbi:hypothetical protein F4811DRAFT_558124 [Daldinia bambusicola]|nr:hypothetical protein F4811DRAFT_558124 [Daldinia bambusicola]